MLLHLLIGERLAVFPLEHRGVALDETLPVFGSLLAPITFLQLLLEVETVFVAFVDVAR